MDYKDLKKIIELIRQNDLTEFEMEQEGFKLSVKAGASGPTEVIAPMAPPPYPMAPMTAPMMLAPPGPEYGIGAPPAAAGEPAAAPDRPGIRSPMVGTFYAAASPDVPPFVKVGDTVGPDTTVCIIECMKVMNQIKAEIAGTIREIKVTNGTPVEYNQVLYTIDPA